MSSHKGAPCSDMLYNSKHCRPAYPKIGARFPCAVHIFALGSSYLMRDTKASDLLLRIPY